MIENKSKKNILQASGLKLMRNGKQLLDGVSLTVRAGSLTMLLGHNGAGKTVLLRALHGLMIPDSGSIAAPPAKDQKMVFQKPILLRRTARSHFRFVCPGLGEAQIDHWFSHAKLEQQMDTHTHRLSGGEQQKLALIGALASKPSLLFLDEPTAHLDYESTTTIETLIKAAHAAGTTIIMTTHNRAQAERLAEDVLFLHEGVLRETGPAAAFFAKPKDPVSIQFLKHL